MGINANVRSSDTKIQYFTFRLNSKILNLLFKMCSSEINLELNLNTKATTPMGIR